jgi:hypothetical protein
MSVKKPRRAGAPAFPGKKPGLRLVKDSDHLPHPEPSPELKAILDDMRRRYRVNLERAGRDPDGKDAA